MLPNPDEFKALLERLRKERTESPNIDGKEDLALDTEGDRAYLIRHIAALSNNVERSYLIIGIKDKSWTPVGLAPDSLLRNADETQQRMNQALAKRIDPSVSIRYSTYEVEEVTYGLIAVEGKSAPYIIAIEDKAYGGNRTKAEPSHIYRGAIYVRRGADSVIANRQSDVLDIIKRGVGNNQPDKVLKDWNYLDIDSNTFGRHSVSNRLIEVHASNDLHPKYAAAQSWASFVFHPVSGICDVDTVALKDKLRPDQRIGRGPEWYRQIPKHFNEMLFTPRATPREFIASYSMNEGITHFIRVLPSGHIEIGCTYPIFFQTDGVRFFSIVILIGNLWQMVYLAKAIYISANFYGEAAILLNLIGTQNTRLADFANGWRQPHDFFYEASGQDVCSDNNIQTKRTLPLTGASDEEIENVVRDIAKDIGNYYGQGDNPRCFDPKTNTFPIDQYKTRM